MQYRNDQLYIISSPAPRGTEPVLPRATLPQPFPFNIDPQPPPVVRLIAEALSLSCQVLGLVSWNTTLVDVVTGCSR